MDAVLAAIALEHRATVCTTDRDFSTVSSDIEAGERTVFRARQQIDLAKPYAGGRDLFGTSGTSGTVTN
jgi:hypothetical protein